MTQKFNLTYKQTVGGLREIVRKRGRRYIYNKDGCAVCVNFEDGQPSCVAGHLYAMHGITGEGGWVAGTVGGARPRHRRGV